MSRVCAFTGHRDLPEDKIEYIVEQLEAEIDKAIANGCKTFISGGARGFDLIAARIVTEKIDYDESIKLILMLPHKGFVNKYDMNYLNPYASKITYVNENFNMSNYLIRDKQMVDSCDTVIAYYDNRSKGGTYYTLKYAAEKNRNIIVLGH